MTCAHRTYYTERGERCRFCGKTAPYSAERRKKQLNGRAEVKLTAMGRSLWMTWSK